MRGTRCSKSMFFRGKMKYKNDSAYWMTKKYAWFSSNPDPIQMEAATWILN